MNDSISRKAAIEAIKEDKIDLTNPNVVAVFKATGDFEKVETQVMTCDRHIKILKDLPSAQPEQRWIPCSEIVDIPDHEVLACDKYGEMIIGYLVYDEQWICESETQFMYDPIAWLPLPEPYKAESEE